MIPNNQPAPDFTLADLDGCLHSLHEVRGRVAIVNFWSAECPHAARVDQELLACLVRWGNQVALVTIAVNANEPPGLLDSTAKQRGLPWVLHDPRQQVADLYGAVTTPHLFVIDHQGILRYQGAYDDTSFRQRNPTRQFLPMAVEAILAGAAPVPNQTPPYGCAIVRYTLGNSTS